VIKATLMKAETELKIKEYDSSLETFKTLRQMLQQNPESDDLDPAKLDYLEAVALQKSGKYEKALNIFLDVILKHPEFENINEARFAVADFAVRENNEKFAIEYYRSILNNTDVNSELYRSHKALGELVFGQKDFEQARSHFESATTLAVSKDQERYVAAQALRCLLKLKQFAAAEMAIKQFKKKYENTELYEGQFILDEAKAYMSAKEFDLAEELYKELKDDFKNTEFEAQGEFGLGALYLVTNHIEDALKTLTRIPEKYPDDEVTPFTYYNLGDFYYKNQQVQNAVHAFQQTLRHEKAGEFHEKAMLYLIQCYSDLNLWDKAIAQTRTFLDLYPDSEQAFRKKIDMAIFLMKLKEFDRSIEKLRYLLPYADRTMEAEIQFYIGENYKEMGNFEKATAEFLKVKYLTQPTKLPWHVTAMFEAARSLLRLGDIEQSKRLFQRIVREQGAESNFGRFALQQLEELETATLPSSNSTNN
jgi:tetratricopeptide (TPR) repeat protein